MNAILLRYLLLSLMTIAIIIGWKSKECLCDVLKRNGMLFWMFAKWYLNTSAIKYTCCNTLSTAVIARVCGNDCWQYLTRSILSGFAVYVVCFRRWLIVCYSFLSCRFASLRQLLKILLNYSAISYMTLLFYVCMDACISLFQNP